MILVIDNYDSFVYNIARYFERAGAGTTVVRNDAISVPGVERLQPSALVISPGPCTPRDAGISIALIKTLGPRVPVLGICLGHQCIGEAYGGRTVRAAPMHGKASPITHTGEGIFAGIEKTVNAGRYHSLVTELPAGSPLKITARGPDDIIMAVQHARHPVYGVQFHPESVLTQQGSAMIGNFLAMARAWNQSRKLAA